MGPSIDGGPTDGRTTLTPWAWTGLLLLLLGLAVTLVAGLSARSEVIGDDTMRVSDGYLEMGPYDIAGGGVQVWIEDYYPGDEWENYDVYASPDEWEEWWGTPPLTSRTRDLDGVECEMVGSFGSLPAGEWTISVESYGDWRDRDDSVHVYVVRTGGAVASFGLAAGLSMLFTGAILTPLVMWPRGKERQAQDDVR